PAGEDENGNFVAAEWEQVGFPEDALFDVAAFNTLLSRATSVRFLEPLGLERKLSYGLDSPLARVTIELESGSKTLTIGAYDQLTDSYVMLADDIGMIIRVPGTAVVEYIVADQAMFTIPPES
ncbi:MAG: DUF4340 domain-containing protein, partial [Chloroflexota bacterium]